MRQEVATQRAQHESAASKLLHVSAVATAARAQVQALQKQLASERSAKVMTSLISGIAGAFLGGAIAGDDD